MKIADTSKKMNKTGNNSGKVRYLLTRKPKHLHIILYINESEELMPRI